MTTRRSTTLFRWVRLAPLKHKRLGAVATLIDDGRVRVQGGQYIDYARGNQTVHPPDEVWDPRTNAWSVPKKTDPAPRQEIIWTHEPTRTPLGDGRVLVTGGKDPGFNAGPFEIEPQPLKDAFIVEKGKRIPAGSVCVARWMHATVVLQDGSVLLIGGADNQGGAIADVEIGLPPASPRVAVFREQLDLQDSDALIAASGRARHEKRYDDALKLARQAFTLTPRHEDAWQELGCVYTALGRHEEALIEYRRLLAKDPTSPFLRLYLAHALLQLNRRREALEAYSKVVALVEAEGEDFTTQRILQEARKQRQALTIELDGPAAGLKVSSPGEDWSTEEWNNRGTALHQQGKSIDALPCFDRALKLDGKNDYAWFNRGTALLALRRPKAARTAFEKSIALRGDRAATALIGHGVACYDLGDFDASLKSYDRALKLHPERARAVIAWTNRGNTLLKLKRTARAGESYGRALKLDPKYITAWHGKVCVASAQGRFKDADAALKRLLQLAPGMESELRRDDDLAAYWSWKARR